MNSAGAEQEPSDEQLTERIAVKIIYALSIMGVILVLGLIVLISLGKDVPNAYIPIVTAIVGALAGALVPHLGKKGG